MMASDQAPPGMKVDQEQHGSREVPQQIARIRTRNFKSLEFWNI
jgi:hypothetical protein